MKTTIAIVILALFVPVSVAAKSIEERVAALEKRVESLERGNELLRRVVQMFRAERRRPIRSPGYRLHRAELRRASQAEIAEHVRHKNGKVWVTRAFFREQILNVDRVSRQVRVVPSIRNAKPAGVKLFALRRGSVLSAIGLRNGDTISAINGRPVLNLEQAEKAHKRLRRARRIVLKLRRRGREQQITVVLTGK